MILLREWTFYGLLQLHTPLTLDDTSKFFLTRLSFNIFDHRGPSFLKAHKKLKSEDGLPTENDFCTFSAGGITSPTIALPLAVDPLLLFKLGMDLFLCGGGTDPPNMPEPPPPQVEARRP